MITEWETDIQFPAGRSGVDKPEHEATYIFPSRVKATEENKGSCLLRIYTIRTSVIVSVRSLQLISVIFNNVREKWRTLVSAVMNLRFP